MGYRVTGGAVVLPTKDGSERYLYTGAPVDEDAFTEEGIQHALSVGLIAETEPVGSIEDDVVEVPEGDPSEDWSNKQLDAYAAAHGIDIKIAKNKAEKLAAFAAASA